MDSILQAPQWPAALADFVTWCLMWDPKSRPTSSQALRHEYFVDAFDPLRPKTSSSRLLSSKKSNLSELNRGDGEQVQSLTTKTSAWFRKSLARENSAPVMPSQVLPSQPAIPSPKPQLVHSNSEQQVQQSVDKSRPNANKRATWNVGLPTNAAPIPILPSIRPISPLVSDGVTVQSTTKPQPQAREQPPKVGRQLSVASHQNHYPDEHRQEAERALGAGVMSPTNSQRESFFSHLRKRARRFSGRYQTPVSPPPDDIDGSAGCGWAPNNRQSMLGAQMGVPGQASQPEFAELDKALKTVRHSLEAQTQPSNGDVPIRTSSNRLSVNPLIKRQHSVPQVNGYVSTMPNGGPISSRTRRAASQKIPSVSQYETPHEEDELLDEALTSVHQAMNKLDRHVQNHPQQHQGQYSYGQGRPQIQQSMTDPTSVASYLMTPSPSANRNNVSFGQGAPQTQTKPMDIKIPQNGQPQYTSQWPTPPYEESDWAAAATASIFAAQGQHH